MKTPSLEDIAERWTFAHTIAVMAWAVVLVLGVVMFIRGHADPYPSTDKLKTYAAENATFTYPENWIINSNCDQEQPFIELPGTIKAGYKGKKMYPLKIYASGAFNCLKDRPERFDIYSENLTASDTPCPLATSTTGERLENGLYLQLREAGGGVTAVQIRQNTCYAPPTTLVLGFAFWDPDAKPDDLEKFGTPRVNKDVLLASKQYRDIRALAESIRY